MNRQDFSNKWHNLKNKVKQKWNRLNDQDISGVNGRYDELCNKLQHKYGWDKAHAEREINSWCSECESCKGKHEGSDMQWQGRDYNEGHNNQWEQKNNNNQWDKQKKQPRKGNEGPEEKRRKAG